ncbi:MAG: hypothetical protein BWY79_00140 [Actinobacteria bacterium ADurb.Bin444]|nr:MAG: hypothetical protein BWY79_00140 [Actinobacteria bacterium ADurb.Bin444]
MREVDHAGLGSADTTVGRSVFDRHPVDQEAVQITVAGNEIGTFRSHQPVKGIIQCFGWEVRIEAGQRVAQATGKDDLSVVIAFCEELAGNHLGAVPDGPAALLEPGQGGFFDV